MISTEGEFLMRIKTRVLSLIVMFLTASASASVTELRLHGYSLIPAPQQVDLEGSDVLIDSQWGVVAAAAEAGPAKDWLVSWTSKLHGINLEGRGKKADTPAPQFAERQRPAESAAEQPGLPSEDVGEWHGDHWE